MCCGREHNLELPKTVFPIPNLIPVSIAHDYKITLTADLCSQAVDQPIAELWREARRRKDIPAKNCLAVDLVHVLTARAGTAHIAQLKFRRGNLNLRCDQKQHESVTRIAVVTVATFDANPTFADLALLDRRLPFAEKADFAHPSMIGPLEKDCQYDCAMPKRRKLHLERF